MRTDEEMEVADALCMASKLADGLDLDIRAWRWVIIAPHNAVQGFMVLSLRHGNGLAALSPKSYAEWMDAYEKGTPRPGYVQLESYLNLYKKIKSKGYSELGGNKRFIPKGTQGKSIKQLKTLRNNFIHFTPKGWSLEIDGLPHICLDCTTLIEFLGWETQNIFWHDPDCREQSQLCCQRFAGQMKHLKGLYESNRS